MISMPRRFLAHAHATLALSAVLALALVGFGPSARAQDPDVDPPGRVARLSAFDGQVWLYSPDSGEWVSAVRNQPLTTGDRIATDNGARAELQIGSTSVRLDSATELEVVELDDEHAALALVEGSAIARLRDLNGAGRLEVSTDEGRFVTLRAGSYRFDRADAKSDVTVYAGQARYEGANSALAVNAGQRAEFWIDSGGVAQYSMLAPINDEFMAWSGERDRRVVGSVAERYVSPEMTGAGELDAYGRWEQDPDYGSVWIPTTVAVDWAPYSHGRWTWVRPWGWTWIDDAPWGFAPFHYGRWVYARNNWCWTPGARVARPIYAPALVAWVGGPRGNVSVTVGGGPAVGWFPLAPREVYVPGYRVSPRYARNLNIPNVTNATLITSAFNNPQAPREFQNRRFPRAITVVPSNVMAERRPVAPAAAQFRQAPWVRELANQPGRTTAMLAPPVTAPTAPARAADPRNVRPPPGFADRPGFGGRPGAPPRDRNEADRDRRPPPRDAQRPEQVPAARPQVPAARPEAPVARPQLPAAQTPAPSVLPERAPIATPALRPSAEPTEPRRPGFDNPGQRPEQRPGLPSRGPGARDGVERPPRAAAPQPVAPAPIAPTPAAPPAQPARPAAAPAPAPEAPTMRVLPVRRGEDQRPEERRASPPRSEPAEQRPPPPPQQQQQQRVERPASPVVQRPVAPTPAPPPVEVRRPAPAVAPAAPAAPAPPAPPPQRAEPRRPDGSRADDPKRGEPRDQR